MADHLPDDPRNWPDDPFRLLGVSPGATETELKRAYTRLIREFKPEHHPEEFRRIREAYEAVQSRLRWYGSPSFELPPRPVRDPEPREQEAVEPGRTPTIDPEVAAWNLALSGEHAAAYTQLVELALAQPEHTTPALRLYWLLAVAPSLDATRTRHDWLAAALIRSEFTGSALELYHRELAANPEAALYGPYCRLVETRDATAFACLRLARVRLAAAGQSASWTVIDIDVCALAGRARELDDATWLSFLVSVMSYVAFHRSPTPSRRCWDLIAGLRHLELQEAWAFDQLDEQRALADAWDGSTDLPQPLREVIRDAWMGGSWRESMARASAWVQEDPAAALSEFDAAAIFPRSDPVLNVFLRLLQEGDAPRTSQYPPRLIRGLMREFLARMGRGPYSSFRPGLIRLLVTEAIDPQEAIEACLVDSGDAARVLVEQLRNDRVLRLVWQTATFTAAQ